MAALMFVGKRILRNLSRPLITLDGRLNVFGKKNFTEPESSTYHSESSFNEINGMTYQSRNDCKIV